MHSPAAPKKPQHTPPLPQIQIPNFKRQQQHVFRVFLFVYSRKIDPELHHMQDPALTQEAGSSSFIVDDPISGFHPQSVACVCSTLIVAAVNMLQRTAEQVAQRNYPAMG